MFLAVVCMAICSALAGVMAKLVFTYDWSWFVALMFGSIISATDPVAVVALLNELGRSFVPSCLFPSCFSHASLDLYQGPYDLHNDNATATS